MNLHSLILIVLVSVFPASTVYTAQGKASFYSDRMQGHRTTSGERYDKAKFTAAHATLPFNTLVQVTSLKNGKKVIVRINDRKANNRHAIIDLSKAAARELDLLRDGVGPVTLLEVKDLPGGQQEAPADVSTASPLN